MNQARKIVLVAMAAGLAACSEGPSAPMTEAPASPVFVNGGGATMDLSATNVVRFSITIDPSRNTYYSLGAGNSLTFPAGSLCDPEESSYGDKEWDKKCKKATAPLTVNVTAWLDETGHARVDFDQHIRFVPSTKPAEWVIITFRDLEAANDPLFNIEYCPAKTSSCKDESKKDPDLRVTKDKATGRIYRRIKHFSGYNVAAGRMGDEDMYNVAPSSSPVVKISALPSFMAPGFFPMMAARFGRRASGYILASG